MPGIRGDDAITSGAEDLLGRKRFADDLADQILQAPLGPGVVVGVVGDWGAGKTSALNMVREAVAAQGDTVILTFDPWMFSGSEELVARFIGELGSQLREGDDDRSGRLQRVGEALLDYGKALAPLVWIPAVGAWAARIASAATAVDSVRAERQSEPSVNTRREQVCRALEELGRRILVVVDDLDRLEAQQIRDVVRLVRLVGNFPNTTYLLAYSRPAVEAALSRDPWRTLEDGAAYLEKIVQAPHELPRPERHRIVELFADDLAALTASISLGPFDEARWHLMLSEGIAGFLGTPRAASRLLNVLASTFRLIGDEIGVADVAALEALRLFSPAAWDHMSGSVAALTGEVDAEGGDIAERRERHRKIVEEVWDSAERRHSREVHALLGILFPYAGALIREQPLPAVPPQESLRVANPDVLRTYLQRALGERRQAGSLARRAFALLGDNVALGAMLDGLDPDALRESVAGLQEFVAQFDAELAESAIPVLMNQMVRLHARPENMFAVSPREQARRVVLGLLLSIPHESERSSILARLLPEVRSLSDRLVLVELAGPRGIRGHDLVARDHAQALRTALAAEVLSATNEELMIERRLYDLLSLVSEEKRDCFGPWAAKRLENDGVLLRLVGSVAREPLRSEAHPSRELESRAFWRTLISWFGTEQLDARLHELARGVTVGPAAQRVHDGIEACAAERESSLLST